MRKVSMALLLGKLNRCLFKKRYIKSKMVSIIAPAGVASDQATFGATLGLYGLRTVEFCFLFNKITARLFKPGTVVSAVIFIYGRSSQLHFLPPTTYNFVSVMYNIRQDRFRHIERDITVYPVILITLYILALVRINSASSMNLSSLMSIIIQIKSQMFTFNLTSPFRWRKVAEDKRKRGSKNRKKKRQGKVKR